MNCDLYPLFLYLYPYIALGRFISQRCFRFLLRLRQIIQMRSLSEISLSYQHSLENLQRLGWPVSFQQILGRGHLSADLPVTTEHQIFISNPTWVFRNLKHIRPFFCVSTFCSSDLHSSSVLLHALFIAHLLVVLVHSLVASTTMSLLLSTKKTTMSLLT